LFQLKGTIQKLMYPEYNINNLKYGGRALEIACSVSLSELYLRFRYRCKVLTVCLAEVCAPPQYNLMKKLQPAFCMAVSVNKRLIDLLYSGLSREVIFL